LRRSNPGEPNLGLQDGIVVLLLNAPEVSGLWLIAIALALMMRER
jgi:hypothetical protein